MPNRSLDDFTGGDGSDEDEVEAEPAPAADASEPEQTEEPETEASEEDAEEPTLTVEEAVPTYDFSPNGAACESCGETVETRWQDPDAGMVCGECKRWD